MFVLSQNLQVFSLLACLHKVCFCILYYFRHVFFCWFYAYGYDITLNCSWFHSTISVTSYHIVSCVKKTLENICFFNLEKWWNEMRYGIWDEEDTKRNGKFNAIPLVSSKQKIRSTNQKYFFGWWWMDGEVIHTIQI